MARPRKYSPEVRARAIRMVREYGSVTTCACARLVKRCAVRRSSRSRPVNDAMSACCVGVPAH